MLERHHVFLAGGQITKPKQSEVGLSADLHTFVSRRSSGCGSSLATTHTNILNFVPGNMFLLFPVWPRMEEEPLPTLC